MSKATPSTDGSDRLDPRRSAARVLVVGWIAVALAACTETSNVPRVEVPPPTAAPSGSPVDFSYETTDGGRISAADLRGRFTVIALAATFDLTSQAQLKVLAMAQRDHRPRVNVAAIVLDPPENRALVIAFAQSLGFQFPVALADEPTLAGHGPFDGLHAVPSIVILDREGREVHRHVGAYDQPQLDAALASVGAR